MKRKSFDIHIELPSAWDWLNFIEKLLIGFAVVLTVFVVFMFVDEALSKTTTEGPFQAVVESVDTETRKHIRIIGKCAYTTTDTTHVVTFADNRRYEFYEENDWFKSIKEDDIVLILGKGRDNYMAIGDEKIPYNDYEEIEEYFTRK